MIDSTHLIKGLTPHSLQIKVRLTQCKLAHIDIDIDADPKHLYANIIITIVKAVVFDIEVVHDIDTVDTHFDLFCHWQYGSTVVCFARIENNTKLHSQGTFGFALQIATNGS